MSETKYTAEKQAAHRKLWTAALRSGEYEQGLSTLKRLRPETTYCCLGVACDLYHKETGKGQWLRENSFEGDAYDDSAAFLPEAVRQYYGFRGANGSFVTEGIATSLARLNDHGADFNEIADRIETEDGLWEK